MDEAELWKGVTNPLARQLLQGVFDSIAFKHTLDRERDYLSLPSAEVLAYRKQLRERLERSGLAAALAAGMDLLPSIYDVLPQPLCTWELLLRPRSYRQLGAHIVRYLDWYLRPGPRLRSDLAGPRNRAIVCGLVGLVSLAALPLLGALSVLILLASALVAAGGYLFSGFSRVPVIEMQAVRSVELLYYLIDTYGDAPVPPDELKQLLDQYEQDQQRTLRLRQRELPRGAGPDFGGL